MKVTTSIGLILAGMVAGVTLVVSCSDDSPGTADAATCDCPAAEIPLAGRFVVVESAPKAIANGGIDAVAAACPTGAQLISGSCTYAATGPQTLFRNVTLIESGIHQPQQNFWSCTYQNDGGQEFTFKASVVCLKPTP